MIPTLWDFLDSGCRLRNSYVRHEGFESLYVRKTPVLARVDNTVTIANVRATRPGNGAFHRLIASLIARGYNIYVECVLNVRLRHTLLELGFTQVGQDSQGGGTNFLLLNARFAGGRDDMSEKSGGGSVGGGSVGGGGGSVGGGGVGGGSGSVGFGGTSNSEVGKVAEKSLKDEEPRDPNGDRDEVDEKYKEPAGTEHSDQYLTKFPNETPG